MMCTARAVRQNAHTSSTQLALTDPNANQTDQKPYNHPTAHQHNQDETNPNANKNDQNPYNHPAAHQHHQEATETDAKTTTRNL